MQERFRSIFGILQPRAQQPRRCPLCVANRSSHAHVMSTPRHSLSFMSLTLACMIKAVVEGSRLPTAPSLHSCMHSFLASSLDLTTEHTLARPHEYTHARAHTHSHTYFRLCLPHAPQTHIHECTHAHAPTPAHFRLATCLYSFRSVSRPFRFWRKVV